MRVDDARARRVDPDTGTNASTGRARARPARGRERSRRHRRARTRARVRARPNAASCHTTTTRPSAATSARGTGGARSRRRPRVAQLRDPRRRTEGGAAVAGDRCDDVAVSPPPRKTSTSVPSGCTVGIANTPSPTAPRRAPRSRRRRGSSARQLVARGLPCSRGSSGRGTGSPARSRRRATPCRTRAAPHGARRGDRRLPGEPVGGVRDEQFGEPGGDPERAHQPAAAHVVIGDDRVADRRMDACGEL